MSMFTSNTALLYGWDADKEIMLCTFFKQAINQSMQVEHIELKTHVNNPQMNYVYLCRQSGCLRTFSPEAGYTHRTRRRLREEEKRLLPSSLHYVWGFWDPELPSFDFDSLMKEENTSGPSFTACICSNAEEEEAPPLLPAVLLLPLSELWHEPPVLRSRLWL